MKARITEDERMLFKMILNSIDQCDATRSKEDKPSLRMAEAYAFRRSIRLVAKCAAMVASLVACAVWLMA